MTAPLAYMHVTLDYLAKRLRTGSFAKMRIIIDLSSANSCVLRKTAQKPRTGTATLTTSLTRIPAMPSESGTAAQPNHATSARIAVKPTYR